MCTIPVSAGVGDNLDKLGPVVGYLQEIVSSIGKPATDTAEATGLYALLGSSESSGEDFSAGTVYSMGDYCIRGGQLYQCVVTSSSSSWVDSEWMPVTGTSMIKSIQRGTGTGNQTITLEHAVNPNRCIVLLNGGNAGGTRLASYSDGLTSGVGNGCYISNITNTDFTIAGASFSLTTHVVDNGYVSTTYNVTYSWQVIEFY